MSGRYGGGRKITGREKCKLLKQIRKEIAEANGIVYLTSECTYEGNDCSGTCPKCDAELRYLDSELNRKATNGSPITLAGLSLDTFFTDEKIRKNVTFDTPIGELHLSAKSKECLTNVGIDTLGILVSSSKDELENLENMNRKCLEEIMQTIESLGFSLTDEDDGVFAEMGSIPCIQYGE